MKPQPFRVSVALALGAGLLAATAQADNFGRETFPHEVVTTIITPADDVDDFVFEGGAGFKLTAGVKRAKGSLLAPKIELVGPDGDVLGLADGVTAKPPGKTSASLKAVLPEGGTYALRVRAQSVSGQATYTTPWEVTVQSADVNPGADTLGVTAHGLVNGDQVEVVSTTDTLPTPLVLDGTYFVAQAATNTFKLATDSAGSSIVDLADAGVGTLALLVTRGPEEIDFGTDTFEKSGHGLVDGDLVRLLSTTGLVPGGLSLGTDYYVVGSSAGAFKLAALPGGAAIDVADNGAGVLTISTTHGSSGAATLKWKLTPAKIAAVKGYAMAGNEIKQFPFAARGGATVSWTLKWSGDGVPGVLRILDPDNKEIAYDTTEFNPYVRRKVGLTSGSETGKNFPIPAERPGGTYKLEVKSPVDPAVVNMAIKVALPKVKSLPVTLTAEEPLLDSVDIDPIVASTGVTLTFTGRGLDSSPQGMNFGGTAATDVVVTQGATADDPDTVTCKVPVGSGTVPVEFVSTDGEVAVLADEFTFRPMPVIASFTPELGPGGGGIEVVLTGSGFETLELTGIYDVRINNVPAWPTSVRVTSPTTMKCKIPANPSGPQVVEVRNVHSNTNAYKVQAPGFFTYTTSLSILYVDPGSVPANFSTGVPVTVFGSGFNATDTVFFEDIVDSDTFTSVVTTPVYFGNAVIGHKIDAADLPQRSAGSYAVRVESLTVPPTTKDNAIVYYAFSDITATAIPAASATDDWGGVSTALADNNQDGVADYLIITHTAALSGGRPGTRVLKNNGSGLFNTDVTTAGMPAADGTNNWAGNKVLATKFNDDSDVDFFLGRPGTGIEATKAPDQRSVVAWSRMFFGGSGDSWQSQVYQGAASKFSIPGILVYGTGCFLFDYDFRSVSSALGDLDGDQDLDIALVNDVSIKSFKGINCNLVWITCTGYYPSCYSSTSYTFGSATRICTLGSTGGVFDRTKEMLKAVYTQSDDFRATAVAIGDMNADFLNDIVITHNQQTGAGTQSPCTRGFKQKSTGSLVTYSKFAGNFVPNPQSGTDDDWRGETVAIPDLNLDLYRDLVVSVDGPMFNGGTYSTRILVQEGVTGAMSDQTATILDGLLPAGDDARAKFVLSVDIDKDNDADLLLCSATSTGGNRMTRLLLNVGKNLETGVPIMVDGSSLLPDFASDPGNATCASVADINGDGALDIVITDTHQTGGPPVKRTRVWKQLR